ncbi:MAG: hypothetical protein IT265_07025 [Saprospiraceae bacterium]|nr:hypothetical protein [Saprospiraceae bacterium]
MKKIILLFLLIIFLCMLIPYLGHSQSKYFNFLKSRSAKIDETYTKLEIVEIDENKYMLNRDTSENGIISFVYTPLEDVFKGLEERFNECDKELEKIGIELETLKMRRKVLLEKKARIEFLMSQE